MQFLKSECEPCDIHVLEGWMLATKTDPVCTIHEDTMWLSLCSMLDEKMVKYAKILTKMVKLRDIAGDAEQEVKIRIH